LSILGNKVLRLEDPKLLSVGGEYVADLKREAMLYVSYVTSTVAHAKILEIDVTEAREISGVVAVYTADDVELAPMASMFRDKPAMNRPFLAKDRVRFVGEPVAMVVATSYEVAADAKEAIFIDYEPLPVVVDPEQAFSDEVVIYDEVGSNKVTTFGEITDDSFFDGSDVIVTLKLRNQRLAPAPLEVRAAMAYVDQDGRLVFYASTQTPHAVKAELSRSLSLDATQVHVITPDVGGGFGAKATQYPEEILLGWAALKLGRPVAWVETRSENMLGLGHGRAQVQTLTLGAKSDGTIVAYRADVIQDSGAYPNVGAFLPMLTKTMAPGIYKIPKVEFRSTSVVTNTTPIVSYRGAGRPEATEAIERALDVLARRLNLDPVEVRKVNLIPADEFPYNTPTGATYDVGDYLGAVEKLMERSDYESLRREQAERILHNATKRLGIGVSTYVEITNPFPSSEFGGVELTEGGGLLIRSGTSPHGQGHRTAWSMVASEIFGIPLEKIEVITGDTDVVPHGVGTFGSRSLQLGGAAVHEASVAALSMAKEVAAEMLEASPSDIVVSEDGSGLAVAGVPASKVSYAQIYEKASELGRKVAFETDFKAANSTFPFGAHLAVVEVDIETGKVKLLRFVAVDDAGKIVAPLLAEGQVHGGIAQGVAQALFEEFSYDPDGNPQTGNLADYTFISAAELPSFEVVHQETPTYLNPLGAKGIGESGTIGSTPAVHNAVLDALAPLGVEHIDMPLTPMRIWRAIVDSQG
jgi:carbon-monoxide dehydrogenase large subunit